MINASSAAAAYANSPQQATPMEARDQDGRGSFAELMAQTGQNAMDNLHQGEQVTMEALVGSADINEVVLAVNQAEMSLQTIVTLRDKVIEAYQEVARMPI